MLKKTESSSTFCNKFECNLQQTALIYAWLNDPPTPHHGFEKKKIVVSLATFVAIQVWCGIPNERVPKSPLK